MTSIADAGPAGVARLLQREGLVLDLGAATLRVRSPSQALAEQIARVYPHFELTAAGPFADFHVQLEVRRGLRRLLRPQIVLRCDGYEPFYPFPADTALPLMEWGTNWLIGERLHHKLLVHAGAVERGGRALLLPATPGSGKSTLTAALALSGWRLLSDEFGVCDPESGDVLALLKPAALKNRSIEVIREFAPQATMGPAFPKTRKGTVAHLAADADAVRRRHEPAAPAALVLPRWSEGSATSIEPIGEEEMFRSLAFNSFNYAMLGAVGFRAAVSIVRRCRGWRLTYSDLGDAVRAIDRLWCELTAQERPAHEDGAAAHGDAAIRV